MEPRAYALTPRCSRIARARLRKTKYWLCPNLHQRRRCSKFSPYKKNGGRVVQAGPIAIPKEERNRTTTRCLASGCGTYNFAVEYSARSSFQPCPLRQIVAHSHRDPYRRLARALAPSRLLGVPGVVEVPHTPVRFHELGVRHAPCVPRAAAKPKKRSKKNKDRQAEARIWYRVTLGAPSGSRC